MNQDESTEVPKEVQEVKEGENTENKQVAQSPRFDLDSMVSEEGSNFSAGERQLLALCRALVKESRVIVMDGMNFT